MHRLRREYTVAVFWYLESNDSMCDKLNALPSHHIKSTERYNTPRLDQQSRRSKIRTYPGYTTPV